MYPNQALLEKAVGKLQAALPESYNAYVEPDGFLGGVPAHLAVGKGGFFRYTVVAELYPKNGSFETKFLVEDRASGAIRNWTQRFSDPIN